ncbi:MAG: UDP-N-acetylmuramoyl-L-alanine--D-glutamate ligase [Candidatus Omnitrophica bacterium]|nr:UDP-N-acetylmuramoyl-L-alanine--D-glutamate ligase [Candidatus Omnitrophota bacterium]MCM8799209.1 UDP-N-acetylmuramoyl-L-alanine--D-glutamate ligase [Candidatus Omnitrophota bacterium]
MLDNPYKNKKIIVVGLGRSGYAVSSLLSDLGAKITVTEKQLNDSLKKVALELQNKGIEVQLGGHQESSVDGKDLVVLSPGVDNNCPIIKLAEERNIPIISEIEVAYSLCPAKIIAVTGTNGKTTVTTLIGNVLSSQGKSVHICGNIGNPFSAEVFKISKDAYVCLEVSSFQLERILNFRPKIAVFLNFSPDHLDRYKNIQDYLIAKKRIFMNQREDDFAVLNYQEISIREITKDIKAKVVYFNRENNINPNFSAVKEVVGLLGVKEEIVEEVFSKFRGIAHRLEYVTEIKGVDFINDSKATNVESCLWALQNIKQPIILIAGGRNKGLKFDKIKGTIKEKVKLMVILGEAKDTLREAFKDTTDILEASSLEEATELAFKFASKGDCVLLSPMCASFDMFRDFEERGMHFKEIVFKISQRYA